VENLGIDSRAKRQRILLTLRISDSHNSTMARWKSQTSTAEEKDNMNEKLLC